MDPDSLKFLLSGGHYNVPDRIARGIWPHPPLKFSEVVDFLAEILKNQEWFPFQWQERKPGEFLDDVGVIERRGQNRFVYRFRRASPIDPRYASQQGELVFPNAEDAARHYLKLELLLPGDLDSWEVVEG